jgi:ABC-type antimicrobial peptide transport system permease subunit
MFLVVRTSRVASADVLGVIKDELRDVDRGAVMTRVQTMAELLAQRVGADRLVTGLMMGFAVLAALLAAVGLYGTMAQWVGQRRRALAVRLALGATRPQVVWLVLSRGLSLAVVGAVVGLLLAAGAARAISALLYGVRPADAFVGVAAVAGLVIVALVACLVPARRAAEAEPVEALRCE